MTSHRCAIENSFIMHRRISDYAYLNKLFINKPLGATITAGAVAGAAGAIASQAVAIGIGLQDDFKWKGIALAAIGGAIGGGLSEFNAFGSAGNLRIAQAAIVAVSGRRSQIPLRPSLRCCVSALPAMRRCILRLTRIVETR